MSLVRRLHIVSLFVLVLASVLLFSCAKKSETEQGTQTAETSETAKPPPQVVVYAATEESVPIFNEWVGQTDASQTVNIKARVDGTLESATFKEGDYVNKGQVLFQIEKDTYQATLQAAKAELEKAQAALNQAQQQVEQKEQKELLSKYESALTRAGQDLMRTRALAEQGAISQHDLDVAVDAERQAKAQVESQKAKVSDTGLNKKSSIQTQLANVEAAKAAVTQANLDLGYTTIRSPLRGIIGKVQVHPGNLVSKADNSILATISEVDPIKVSFSISEAEYLKFAKEYAKTGKAETASLELKLADNTVYPVKGKFQWLDRAVDAKTGTIAVEAVFANPKAILRPGQFCRVRTLVATRKNAIVIPEKCIQDLQGSKTVYVVGAGNKVELKNVNVGPKTNDKVVIEKGLNVGDKVIVEGLQKAHAGKEVVISSGSAP